MKLNIDYTQLAEITHNIHQLEYPVWVFDSTTLTIVDGNKQAIEFCLYEMHDFIGLSIKELWHGEDLADILDDIEGHQYERSFFGNLNHKKKNGEIVVMRVHATRITQSDARWIVHLVSKRGGYG